MSLEPTILPFNGKHPRIAEDAFIAPGARIIGDVEIGPGASVWYNCVLRAEGPGIRVGAGSNIQDGSVIHITRANEGTIIGENCLIGHMAMVHGCVLKDYSFVGLGAIVMDNAVIETDGMLAAGGMLTPGKTIPAGEVWGGRPAAFMSRLSEERRMKNRRGPAEYAALAQMHRAVVDGAGS
ncbi:MAG: gamma carbonic anhydrase family protein [Pacificimonas sp.]|jgi:carbonic anhydrase/acetyltransferase-like protein (isoleucine patch superfamily)|nr:gamma carbonic anhydrase family protein [Pacificimonas sp.]